MNVSSEFLLVRCGVREKVEMLPDLGLDLPIPASRDLWVRSVEGLLVTIPST